VTPGPEERAVTGRGHLRAAHADREHVIAQLKAAFVHGRLTKDELDVRVGQTLASRTYADLAALTADIPAGPVTAESPGSPARTMVKAACRSAVCLLLAVALVEGGFLANSFDLIILAFMAVMAASGFFGYGVIDSWHERRARVQLPPGPGRGGQRLAGRRPSGTGHEPALLRTRADQNRAGLRADRPGRDRWARAQRIVRPVPGTL